MAILTGDYAKVWAETNKALDNLGVARWTAPRSSATMPRVSIRSEVSHEAIRPGHRLEARALGRIRQGARSRVAWGARTDPQSNIRNYSIFHRGGQLFAYFEYVGDDFEGDMKKMADDAETQRWWDQMMPLQEPLADRAEGEWWSDMQEVFHTD